MARSADIKYPYPTEPAPGVPLDQTMAPVDFEGRDLNGKRPPVLRRKLKAVFHRLLPRPGGR